MTEIVLWGVLIACFWWVPVGLVWLGFSSLAIAFGRFPVSITTIGFIAWALADGTTALSVVALCLLASFVIAIGEAFIAEEKARKDRQARADDWWRAQRQSADLTD